MQNAEEGWKAKRANLLGILAGGVEEEAGADGLADAVEVGAR